MGNGLEPGTSIAKSDLPAGKLIARMADKFGVDENKLLSTLKNTAFRVREGEVSNEQMMALMVVADQYGLNPFTKEIYAFPDKNNGIVPVVGVDGWSRIINQHKQLDGIDFRYSEEIIAPGDERCPGLRHPANEWIECIIHRKDRSQPTEIREYLDEVYRPPFEKEGRNGKYVVESAWQTHTRRFHRHKALIQCARVAFGFAGIYDEDEAARILEARRGEDGSFEVVPPKGKPEVDAPQSKSGKGKPGKKGEAKAATNGSQSRFFVDPEANVVERETGQIVPEEFVTRNDDGSFTVSEDFDQQ